MTVVMLTEISDHINHLGLFQVTSNDLRSLTLQAMISHRGQDILLLPNVPEVISHITTLNGNRAGFIEINCLGMINVSIFTNRISQN